MVNGGGGVMGFLAVGGIVAVGFELAKLVEDSLSGGFVADDCAYVIRFEEGRETGEVAGTEDIGEEVGLGGFNDGLAVGGRWITEEDGEFAGTEFLDKSRGADEEFEGSVVVWERGLILRRDAGAHAGRDAGVSGLVGGGIGGVGGFGVGLSVEGARLNLGGARRHGRELGWELEEKGTGDGAELLKGRVEC